MGRSSSDLDGTTQPHARSNIDYNSNSYDTEASADNSFESCEPVRPSDSTSQRASSSHPRNFQSKDAGKRKQSKRRHKLANEARAGSRHRSVSQKIRQVRVKSHERSSTSSASEESESTMESSSINKRGASWGRSYSRPGRLNDNTLSSQYFNSSSHAGVVPYDHTHKNPFITRENFFGNGHVGPQELYPTDSSQYNYQQYPHQQMPPSSQQNSWPPPPPPTDISTPQAPAPSPNEEKKKFKEQIQDLMNMFAEKEKAIIAEKQELQRELDQIKAKEKQRDDENERKKFEARVKKDAELEFQRKMQVMERDEELRKEELRVALEKQEEVLKEVRKEVEKKTLEAVEVERKAATERERIQEETRAQIEKEVNQRLEAEKREIETRNRKAAEAAAKVDLDAGLRESPVSPAQRDAPRNRRRGEQDEYNIREILREFREEFMAEIFAENRRLFTPSLHKDRHASIRRPGPIGHTEAAQSPWDYHDMMFPSRHISPRLDRSAPRAFRPDATPVGISLPTPNGYSSRYTYLPKAAPSPPPLRHRGIRTPTEIRAETLFRDRHVYDGQVKQTKGSRVKNEDFGGATVMPRIVNSRRGSVSEDSRASSQPETSRLHLGSEHDLAFEQPKHASAEEHEGETYRTPQNSPVGYEMNGDYGMKSRISPSGFAEVSSIKAEGNKEKGPLGQNPEIQEPDEDDNHRDSKELPQKPEVYNAERKQPNIAAIDSPIQGREGDESAGSHWRFAPQDRPDTSARRNLPRLNTFVESIQGDEHSDYDAFSSRRGTEERRPFHEYMSGGRGEEPRDTYSTRSFDGDQEVPRHAYGIPGVGMPWNAIPCVLLPTYVSGPAPQTIGVPYGVAPQRIDRRNQRYHHAHEMGR